MEKKQPGSDKFSSIRKQAVEFLNKIPEDGNKKPGYDVRNLIEELQIHQIELEIQNEELHQAQNDVIQFDAQPESILVEDAEGNITQTRTAITDISDRRQAKDKLLKAYEEMEQQVKDRTCELTEANKALKQQIEERRQAEDALQKSRAKYQDLYDYAPDMYVSVDAKTANILDCNQTLADALGYKKEKIIGRPIFDLYTSESAEYAKANVFPEFVKSGIIQEKELQLQRKDGSVIDVSLNASVVRDKKGNVLHIRSSWRDITEKKKLQAQLQQAHKMEALGILAGGIAHDFNNILASIIF